MKSEQAYKEIISMLKKHRNVISFDVDDLIEKSKIHLFAIKLQDVYGLDVKNHSINSLDWNNIDSYRTIGIWGTKWNRTIGWPNDGRQPKNEYLLQICFPTGAYMFGQDYPVELFKSFFNELKSFNPDYVDDHNNGLYWKLENAKEIFNSFNDILKKYYELNKKDVAQRKILAMQKEIERLTNLNQ